MPEYALMERLFGKNTIQAARIIAEEFVARFGTISGTVDLLTRRLMPSGRASTWADLEGRIFEICKWDMGAWEIAHLDEKLLNIEEELFLYRVVDVILALPKKRDYIRSENKIDFNDPKSIADNFTTCELCWRSVPRLTHRKKIHLCHLHDIPSTAPEYRRRKRFQENIHRIAIRLKNCMPPPLVVGRRYGVRPDIYTMELCLSPDGPLTYLVDYLKSLKMPLRTGEDFLRALEHPVYWDKLDERLTRAWEFYFGDRGIYFEWHYTRIVLAEAWLRAEAAHQHGGNRRDDGSVPPWLRFEHDLFDD